MTHRCNSVNFLPDLHTKNKYLSFEELGRVLAVLSEHYPDHSMFIHEYALIINSCHLLVKSTQNELFL